MVYKGNRTVIQEDDNHPLELRVALKIVVGCGTYDGGGYITTSEDGLNWSSPEQLDATNTFYGVCAI